MEKESEPNIKTLYADLGNILESALNNFYRRKYGLNILFAGLDKAPRTLWEKWQKTRQSDDDIRRLYQAAENATCWGFVCGFNGLEAFDFDWPWVYRLWRKHFGVRAETLIVKTPNGGSRPYYFVDTPITEMLYKATLHMEIKGPGQFAVHEGIVRRDDGEMGTYHLELDLEIQRDNKIFGDSVKWLQELNQRYEFLQWSCLHEKYFSKKIIPDLPHEVRLMLVSLMVYNGFEQDEILNFFEDQSDYKKSITLYQTHYTEKKVEQGLKPPRCETLRKTLYWSKESCKGCLRKQVAPEKKKEETPTIKTPFVELSDGRLAEQGFDGKKVYYLVYDPKDGVVKKEDFLVEGEVRFEPIFNKDVETYQVLLPSDATDYGNEKALWNGIISFLDYWHEERNRGERILDAAYGYATYLRKLLLIMGYRRKLGPYGKGKTTAIDVIGAICYRPFYLAGCSSEAAIRRVFDQWQGTAIMDEADFSRSDLYATIIKIINIGDDARLGWYRCCDENDPNKVLSFYVYGPKLIATRQRFKDIAAESRCLTSVTEENIEAKPLFRGKKFLAQALELRNQLTMWQFRHYHKLKERVKALETPEIAEKIFGKDFKVSGRVKQILLPVALAIEDPEVINHLKATGLELQATLESIDWEQALKTQVEEALKQILGELQDVKELQHYGSAEVDPTTGLVKVRLPDITRKILGEDADSDDLKGYSQNVRNYLVNRRRLRIRAESHNVRWVYLSPGILGELGFEKLGPRPIMPITPSEPVTPTLTSLERFDDPGQGLMGLKFSLKAEKKEEQQKEPKMICSNCNMPIRIGEPRTFYKGMPIHTHCPESGISESVDFLMSTESKLLKHVVGLAVEGLQEIFIDRIAERAFKYWLGLPGKLQTWDMLADICIMFINQKTVHELCHVLGSCNENAAHAAETIISINVGSATFQVPNLPAIELKG